MFGLIEVCVCSMCVSQSLNGDDKTLRDSRKKAESGQLGRIPCTVEVAIEGLS